MPTKATAFWMRVYTATKACQKGNLSLFGEICFRKRPIRKISDLLSEFITDFFLISKKESEKDSTHIANTKGFLVR